MTETKIDEMYKVESFNGVPFISVNGKRYMVQRMNSGKPYIMIGFKCYLTEKMKADLQSIIA